MSDYFTELGWGLINEISMSNRTSRIIIYHVLTRLFGNTNTGNIPWGTIEENGVGKFDDFNEKALTALKEQGYTHIWFTGVIHHAHIRDLREFNIPLDDAFVVKGRAGSPYAIKDYYDVDPDLANNIEERMSEFEALVERTHKAGLNVVIDFVPNHVARSYSSLCAPEGVVGLGEDDDVTKGFDVDNNFYYILDQELHVPEGYVPLGDKDLPQEVNFHEEYPVKASGNDVFSSYPSINDWFETVKINYGVDYMNHRSTHFESIPDTWNKMRDILLFWAEKGVDGFRCDMSEMVPVEFWMWVVEQVRTKYPNVLFIAEIYNPQSYRTYLQAFDYLYDKVDLYDSLKDIIQGHKNTDSITHVWQSQDGIYNKMLRFLENHDEQRIASRFFAGDMLKGIPMMAVTSFMHTGPVMMYFGQEFGEAALGEPGFSGDDGRTSIFDYWGVPEHVKWVNNGAFDGGLLDDRQRILHQKYVKILKQCNEYEAIREGELFDLQYFNRNGYSEKIFSFIRHSSNQLVLIVVNFSEHSEVAKIKIPDSAWECANRTPRIHEITLTISSLDYIILQLD